MQAGRVRGHLRTNRLICRRTAQLPEESIDSLSDEASLLNDEALLLASVLRSLPVFLMSSFVSLEQAAGASIVTAAMAATTNGVVRLGMASRYPARREVSRLSFSARPATIHVAGTPNRTHRDIRVPRTSLRRQ